MNARRTLMGGLLAAATVSAGAAEEVPKGYQQLLPRGRIASIDSPRFVPAATASLPGDAWCWAWWSRARPGPIA